LGIARANEDQLTPKVFSQMMRTLQRGLACALLLTGACVWAQNDGVTIGVQESQRSVNSEPDPDSAGIPMSKILRDTEPPYESAFQDIKLGSREQAKIGSGGTLFETHLFYGPGFNIPLIRPGGRPEHAQIKIGRFYLDVRFFSASVLLSDNVSLTNPRKSGAIAIMRLGAIGIYQLTDSVRLSMAGTLIYLPFRNKLGIAGFGIDDALAEFEYTPLAQAQLAYNMEIARWDVQVYDEFQIAHRRIGLDEDYQLFNGIGFNEEDRAGRYVFGDNTALPPAGGARRDLNGSLSASLIEMRNVFGFSAGRLLPTETRVEFGANHSDYWYQGPHGFLPSSRNAIYALAQSERENLRFQPFASYYADQYNYDPNWNHELRAGIAGPITENLDILGEAGYHWSDNLLRNTTVWRARLRHTLSPYTYHEFEYHRVVTEPVRDLEESYFYRLHQILGPYLYGEAYANRASFEPLERGRFSSVEDRVGVRLTANLGLHTTGRFGVTYSNIRLQNPTQDRLEAWQVRDELIYKYAPTVDFILTYQYQNVSSSRPMDSYHENFVLLTVTKYF